MIRKFDARGNIVTFDDTKTPVPGSPDQTIDNPQLMSGPEQKYVGTWAPGKNQPSAAADKSGPYAGIVRYLPIPEGQIER